MAKKKKGATDKSAIMPKMLARAAPKTEETRNPITKLRRYLKGARSELGKVVWPSRPEIVQSTIVVLATVAFFSLFIGGLDLIFSAVVKQVAGK